MQYLRNLVLFSRIDSSRLLHTAVHALTQFNQLQQLSDVLSAVLTVQGHLYLLLPITGTTIKKLIPMQRDNPMENPILFVIRKLS